MDRRDGRTGGRRVRDRRATPRLQVELDCEQSLGSGYYFGITWDLSTFGFSTRHGTPHEPGTRLNVTLHLPDGEGPLISEAEVVGVNAESGGTRLAFRNPGMDVVRRIHRYLTLVSADVLSTQAG
jgi:hypothetical protein